MPRSQLAKFLIALGVMFSIHGGATWTRGATSQGVLILGFDIDVLVAILTGIVTSAILVRWLLPALCHGSKTRQAYVVPCVCVIAIAAALFGFCDFNLVTMFNDFTPADSVNLKSWLRPNIFPWTIATVAMWLVFVIMYVVLCGLILREIAGKARVAAKITLIVAAIGLLIGILGYGVARIAGPMLTGLWKGPWHTGNQMMLAVSELGRYLKWDGFVLAVSGLGIAVIGSLLPRVLIDGICSKCGYPVERERCPECGTLVRKSVYRETV